MATQDIKDLINEKIKANGKGEITGEVLNEVLNAMANAVANGYKFLGADFIGEAKPEIPDGGKYFCIAYNEDDGALCIYTSNSGSWDDSYFFYRYDDAETIESNAEESDGYITPKGLVDYVNSTSNNGIYEIPYTSNELAHGKIITNEEYEKIKKAQILKFPRITTLYYRIFPSCLKNIDLAGNTNVFSFMTGYYEQEITVQASQNYIATFIAAEVPYDEGGAVHEYEVLAVLSGNSQHSPVLFMCGT